MTIDMAGKPGSYRPPAAPGWKPLGPRRAVTAQSMRKLAKRLDTEHPLMNSGQHLRDAANALEDGNHEGAQRHLTAAIGNMTPQSLRRHGMLDDASHNMAKSNMDAVHRHLLLVKDIADTHAQNQALINRVSTEDNNRPAQDTGGADPQHLPQTPRQPAGNQAVNAPRNLGTGGPDQSIAKPKQITSPQITKQIAASQSGDLTTAIELVGPKGFIHGWIHVGAGHADLSQHSADDVARVAAHHPDPAARQAAKAELKKRMGLGQRVGAAIAKNLREGNEGSDLPSGPGQHGGLYGQVAPRRLGAQVVGLSAETARLAVQPHPFGKPGGPGLWHVKDMELPPYVQNIAHALLRTGRARDEGSAIAMARAATKRWMHGVHTTPEVRAASTASDAEWRAGQARAHATR